MTSAQIEQAAKKLDGWQAMCIMVTNTTRD
jgi:hypothetical protein